MGKKVQYNYLVILNTLATFLLSKYSKILEDIWICHKWLETHERGAQSKLIDKLSPWELKPSLEIDQGTLFCLQKPIKVRGLTVLESNSAVNSLVDGCSKANTVGESNIFPMHLQSPYYELKTMEKTSPQLMDERLARNQAFDQPKKDHHFDQMKRNQTPDLPPQTSL